MEWLESLDMKDKSGKESLSVLISECRNLRASILNVTKTGKTIITVRNLSR